MDTVFLSLKQNESLGNNQNSAFLTPIKPENFYQVLWGAFLCGHMENVVFLGENAWFLKCMQKTPRIIGFPDKHLLTGDKWIMVDA